MVLLLAQLGTSHLRGVALLVCLLGVSIVTMERMETYASTVPSRPPVVPRDLEPLVSTPYERAVEASRHAFVFFRSSLETGADRTPGPEAQARVEQLRTFVSRLEGYRYRRIVVEPFVVYVPSP